MYDENYRRAIKKVKRKRSFFIHAIIWIFGSIFLFLINYTLIYIWEPWFVVPVSIWGLALLIHGIFAFTGLGSKEWMDKEILKEIEKLESKDKFELDHTPEKPLPLQQIEKENKNLDDEDFV